MAPAGESLVTSSIKRPFSSKTPMHHLSPSFFRNTYFWNSPVFSADSIAYSIWREYPFNLSLIHDAKIIMATNRIPWFLGILPNHPSIFKKTSLLLSRLGRRRSPPPPPGQAHFSDSFQDAPSPPPCTPFRIFLTSDSLTPETLSARRKTKIRFARNF